MKTHQRIIALALALIIALAPAACGGGTEDEQSPNDEIGDVAETYAPSPTAEATPSPTPSPTTSPTPTPTPTPCSDAGSHAQPDPHAHSLRPREPGTVSRALRRAERDPLPDALRHSGALRRRPHRVLQ